MSFSLSFTGNTRSTHQLVQFVSFFPISISQIISVYFDNSLSTWFSNTPAGIAPKSLSHLLCQHCRQSNLSKSISCFEGIQFTCLVPRAKKWFGEGNPVLLQWPYFIFGYHRHYLNVFFCCCCKSKCEMSALTWVEHGWTGSWLKFFTGSQINKFNISI